MGSRSVSSVRERRISCGCGASRPSKTSAWPCSRSSGRTTNSGCWRSTTIGVQPKCDAISTGWTRPRRSDYLQTTVQEPWGATSPSWAQCRATLSYSRKKVGRRRALRCASSSRVGFVITRPPGVSGSSRPRSWSRARPAAADTAPDRGSPPGRCNTRLSGRHAIRPASACRSTSHTPRPTQRGCPPRSNSIRRGSCGAEPRPPTSCSARYRPGCRSSIRGGSVVNRAKASRSGQPPTPVDPD